MINTWRNYQEKSQLNESYCPFELKDTYSSIKINKQLNINNKMVFIAEKLKEEVLNGNLNHQKKKIKQLKKMFKQFLKIFMKTGAIVSLLSINLHPLTTFANTPYQSTSINQYPKIDIDPSTIMEWGKMLALIIVAIGASLAMVMFACVGIFLMITKNKKESIEWNSSITKGLIQVLIAVPLVYAIFHLAVLIFKNLNFLNGFF